MQDQYFKAIMFLIYIRWHVESDVLKPKLVTQPPDTHLPTLLSHFRQFVPQAKTYYSKWKCFPIGY